MRVLVTGGAGFIGSFVVDPLVAAGHTVRITLTGREDLQPRITGQFRRGDVRHYTADIRRARETLGFTPRVAWEDGLRELLEWCRGTASADHFTRAQGELERHGLLTGAIGPTRGKESRA
jgi:nucleoside-diphosphate-sugar epimerase